MERKNKKQDKLIKHFSYHQLNHKGSTLLLVIICLAFLGILGSLMLSVSMVNLQMKKVESNSKGNFYTCEKALEEIRAGLEELTAKSIQEEYENVLQDYSTYATMSDSERNSKIQKKVIEILEGKLGTEASVTLTMFRDQFLSDKSFYHISQRDNPIKAYSTDDNTYLLFQDIIIEYTRTGYQSSITSDIRITLPSFTFTKGSDTVSYQMKQPYEGYTLVADGNIESTNTIGDNLITGNVYAGKDIIISDTDLMHDHKVTIDGNYVITRGNLKVENTAGLTIGNSSKPLVWANNILTDTTSSYLSTYTTKTDLTINGVCLVKDDLTLEARNSNVVLKGAYVGYSGVHSASGSAIIVNGSGSGMDLSGLTSLILAGRAHVSVIDSIYKNNHIGNPDIDILTGESLAFKSNQRAYLVPGEYIYLGIGASAKAALHNPITQKDLLSGAVNVLITTPSDSSKIDLTKYIDTAKPSKKVSKQNVLGDVSPLTYYYLNFKDGKRADEFLAAYMATYPKALQVLDTFPLKAIKLPSTADIISVGNVMYYDPANPITPLDYKPGLSSGFTEDETLDTAIADRTFASVNNSTAYQGTDITDLKVGNLPDLYFNMTHYLSPLASKISYKPEDQVVASTVLKSGITEINSEYTTDNYSLKSLGFQYYNSLPAIGNPLANTDIAKKSVVILNQDVNIAANSYFNGLLITTGSVTIGDGAKINGIIIAAGTTSMGGNVGNVTIGNHVKIYGRVIATGDILLGTGCEINCFTNTSFDTSLTVDTFLESIFHNDGDILWKMFRNPEVSINFSTGSSVGDNVDIKNLVTCENWRRNE